mmetsp:Transcript_15682/g.36779  ORF Transcript_15682/g.36779 Transcript_15682/m.36779 type:complete len:374 (-) Transcript_15682:42-1163(-)
MLRQVPVSAAQHGTSSPRLEAIRSSSSVAARRPSPPAFERAVSKPSAWAALACGVLCGGVSARRRRQLPVRSTPRFSSPATGDTDWHDLRFRGVALLLGDAAAQKLKSSHAAVLGLGGVGSWVVEALARSGVGTLTLVDFDDICISNTNRQLHTLTATVGQAKVDALAERVRDINPQCDVRVVRDFFCQETASEILAQGELHVVVDAIDVYTEKACMVANCCALGIPVVISGSLGGKSNPGEFRAADLTEAYGDGLLRRVRDTLRSSYSFPAGEPNPKRARKKWGIDCVFSPEKAKEVECSAVQAERVRRNCNTTFGTFCPAAGVLGFLLADRAMQHLIDDSWHGSETSETLREIAANALRQAADAKKQTLTV